MPTDALFEPLAPLAYAPTERALGPWGKGQLHGGAVAALLAHVVERHAAGDGLRPARLCVDLFRAVSPAPLEVEVETLRHGPRLHAVSATLRQAGAAVSHAVGLLVRPSAEPPVALPQSSARMPPPETFDALMVPPEPITHASSLEIRGHMRRDGATAGEGLWIRTIFPVVAGHALTPFARAAAVSDWSNPVANYGSEGINFINVDVTCYLYREPRGEWLGLAPAARHSADGVALGDCTLHDLAGPVGRCLTASLATQTMASGRRPRGG